LGFADWTAAADRDSVAMLARPGKFGSGVESRPGAQRPNGQVATRLIRLRSAGSLDWVVRREIATGNDAVAIRTAIPTASGRRGCSEVDGMRGCSPYAAHRETRSPLSWPLSLDMPVFER
jgi:hypothetical protein